MKFIHYIAFSVLCPIAAGRFLMPAEMKEWRDFKTKYGKSYDSVDEEKQRHMVYLENKKTVEAHNAGYEAGEVTYTMALNKFSDLTFEEFHDQYLQNNNMVAIEKPRKTIKLNVMNTDFPDSVDWRLVGAVTPVKDQGNGTTSFTFAAVGAVEGNHAIVTKSLVPLSVQQVMDCINSTEQHGPTSLNEVFQYIRDNSGLDKESFYPSTKSVGPCKFDPDQVGGKILAYTMWFNTSEYFLEFFVGIAGPVAVTTEVQNSFMLYGSGIYYGTDCTGEYTDLNHAALAVGYGTENGTDYYIVKNSWGADWGEDGYIRMARNRDNNCGIASLFASQYS